MAKTKMRNRIHRFSLKSIYGSLVSNASCHLTFLGKYRARMRRLLYLSVVVPFLVILLGGSFAGVLMSLLSQPAAYADTGGEEYTVNVNSSQAAAVDSCIKDGKCTVSGLQNVEAAARGGVFGDSAITLKYEADEDSSNLSGSDAPDPEPPQMYFTGNYTCDQDSFDYSVSVILYVSNYSSTSANPYSAQLYLDNIRNTNNTNGSHPADTVDRGSGGGDGTLSQSDIQNSGIPSSCLPSNLSTSYSGTNQPSLTHTFNVTNYADLSPILKTAFGTAIANPPASTGPIGGSPGPTCGTSTTPPCFVCNSGTTILGFIPNPLDFLLCGIINGMYLIVSNLDTQINNMLEIGTSNTSSDDPNQIFADTSSCPGGATTCTTYQDANAYQTAWSQFRNIALALLVVVALIIIIAQALGMEILDAYTIRKMLPRVLIATIGITLSWSIMRFLVTLSNDLGYGVGDLIGAPFSKIGIDIKFSTGGSVLATAVAGGALAVFDLFGLLGFVGTAMVAVLITFVVLIIRQIAVILLIILAPVAMIAYVLPGTLRIYKMWWESLSKMLLMFPMIVALITAGHIFSAIASSNAKTATGSTQLADTIIAIFAYFAPYFMVPLTFRFSGTLMGTIGGAVNSRGEPARAMMRNLRSGRSKENLARMKAGTRLEDKSYIPTRFTKAFNATTRGVGLGWKGRYGLGERGQSARGYGLMAAEAELRKSPGMQAIAGNNKANRILAEAEGDEEKGRKALYDHLMSGGDLGDEEWSEADAKAAVDRAAKDAKAAGGFTKAHGAAAFMSMAADGTAIRDTDDLARLAAKVGNGDRNATFHYAATAAGMSRNAGRPELAAASEPIGDLAFAHSDEIFKNNLGSGKGMAELRAAAWESGAGGEVAYTKFGSAKSRTIRNDTRGAVDILKAHKEAIESGQASPFAAKDVQFAAASLIETQSAIDNNYGKLNNRIAAGNELKKDEGALQYYLKANSGQTVTENRPVAGPRADVGSQPLVAPVTRPLTNEEVVKKIVGDRFSNMTPEQREQLEHQRGNQDEEENP